MTARIHVDFTPEDLARLRRAVGTAGSIENFIRDAALQRLDTEADPKYELRISAYTPDRPFPKTTTLASDFEIWQKFKGEPPNPDDGQELDFTGLEGVEGLAEATAREFKADGAKRVIIERREVSSWREID